MFFNVWINDSSSKLNIRSNNSNNILYKRAKTIKFFYIFNILKTVNRINQTYHKTNLFLKYCIWEKL